MIKRILCAVLWIVSCESEVLALETQTHQMLNAYISNVTTPDGFNLDSHLKNSLGISNGIREMVSGNLRIWEWLMGGGECEDVPAWYQQYVRSVNHFYDPISNKGLQGTTNSSLQWALMPKGTQNVGGYYSWFDARDYFYQALTGKNKTTRDDYYGRTFRALGQLTHLVQDLSVPAHVRDDGHVLTISSLGNYQYYEKWVKANANISSLAAHPVFFDLNALSKPNSLGSVPVANLFDTNTFTGINPNVSTRANVGLSEYANPNFLSDDTMFTEDYIYPGKNWLDVWTDSSVNRKYFRKLYEGDPVNHLAAVSWLYWYRIEYFPEGDQYLPVGLDPLCHSEYASKLIPYAAGYSTSLLNYFFRGAIDMVPDDTGSGFVIKNNTDEDMSGTFELWYDNKNDERSKVWSASSYIGGKSSGNNKSSVLSVTPPADAREPNKYMLVFKGKMGSEDNAVAAKRVELDAEYLFLVNVWPYNVQTYRIGFSNGTYQLTPAQKEVNIRYSAEERRWGRNLTIQSNTEMTEHYAVLPFVSVDATGKNIYQTYRGYIANYGIGAADYCYSYWWYGFQCDYTYDGSPSYYRPENLSSGSAYILAYNGLTSYSDSNPHPVVSGRRPFEIVKGKLVADDISVWQEQKRFFMRHKDESGNWVAGPDLVDKSTSADTATTYTFHVDSINSDPSVIYSTATTSTSTPPSYLAVLSENKVLYQKTDTSSSESVNLTGPVGIFFEPKIGYFEKEFFYSAHYAGNSTQKSYLKIGDTTIEEFDLISAFQNKGIAYTRAYAATEQEVIDKSTHPLEDITIHEEWTTNGKWFDQLLDYDSYEGDQEFIAFYKYDDMSSFTSEDGIFSVWSYSNDIWTSRQTGFHSTVKYGMVYSINGNLSRTDIEPNYQTSDSSTSGQVEITGGQRIKGLSLQINKKNMVYTYIVEGWNESSKTWSFVKRIIGIINIRDNALPVGHRQEFELYLPGNNFNPSDLAAIGVTR